MVAWDSVMVLVTTGVLPPTLNWPSDTVGTDQIGDLEEKRK